MYILSTREPAFSTTPLSAVMRTAIERLNRELKGYEYVTERQVEVLVNDSRDTQAVRKEAAAACHVTQDPTFERHLARRIEGGWELFLIVRGD